MSRTDRRVRLAVHNALLKHEEKPLGSPRGYLHARPEWQFQWLRVDQNYDAFVQAYLKREIKRLALVMRLE